MVKYASSLGVRVGKGPHVSMCTRSPMDVARLALLEKGACGDLPIRHGIHRGVVGYGTEGLTIPVA